eukprot:1559352-Ditylum_brightwellii.AAC.1
MQKCVENITNPEFEIVKQVLTNTFLEIDRGDHAMKIKELTDMVESTQGTLDKDDEEDMVEKSRRGNFQYERSDGEQP